MGKSQCAHSLQRMADASNRSTTQECRLDFGRARLGCWSQKTSIRHKARILASTKSDDANPANEQGKECVKSVCSSSKVMKASNALPYSADQVFSKASRTAHAPAIWRSRMWSMCLPNTTSGALLPAIGQDQLPYCNS